VYPSARPPITVALVDHYDVVLIGVAHMVENDDYRVVIVELDATTDVQDSVHIVLHDSFAQPESDHHEIGEQVVGNAVRKGPSASAGSPRRTGWLVPIRPQRLTRVAWEGPPQERRPVRVGRNWYDTTFLPKADRVRATSGHALAGVVGPLIEVRFPASLRTQRATA
jgi:hypothetical protein